MRSATAFLPPCMITFMNLASSTLPYLGSGRISRLGTSRRRGMFHLFNCFSWLAFAGRGSQQTSHLLDPAGQFRFADHYAFSRLPERREHRQTNDSLGLLRAL